jgi:excisionase family DNA binding protein
MSKTPTLPKLNEQMEPEAVRVSVSEAARLFGINARTVRRAIASGDIRYIVVRGRYKLHFGSLVTWSQRATAVRNKRDQRGIGQWIEQWKIKNPKFSPRPPAETK